MRRQALALLSKTEVDDTGPWLWWEMASDIRAIFVPGRGPASRDPAWTLLQGKALSAID